MFKFKQITVHLYIYYSTTSEGKSIANYTTRSLIFLKSSRMHLQEVRYTTTVQYSQTSDRYHNASWKTFFKSSYIFF